MLNFNKILKNANLYSVEYTGYFSFKFSVSNELNSQVESIVVEFVSGCKIFDSAKKSLDLQENVFGLYSANIINARLLKENQLELEFDNGTHVVSINDTNELVDRNWVLKINENNSSYILNDSGDLFYSEDMRSLIET